MGKHQKSATRKWRPYVTTGIALEAAALFAFAYATDTHVTPNSLLAATTSIFVDGTKSLTGNESGGPDRMKDSLDGNYDQTSVSPDNNQFVQYPRSLGPLTGLGDPTYDASEGVATAETVRLVKAARAQNGPDAKIFVVGYSQGAGAASQAMAELENEGVDTTNIEFVLAADPRRNDGGILARLPKGVYVPIIGVTFGDGTSPQNPNTKVLQVTKQYDGVGDAPRYVFNVVADANAILGYYYLHPGYYENVDPTPDTTADDRIVTTSADGSITDVLIKAPVGELPLTMPLKQLGVPQSVLVALDPFLRAVIETGYDRPTGNDFPTEPVPFSLLPPPTRWVSDVQSVSAGAVQTAQALTGTTPAPNPLAGNTNRVSTFSEPVEQEPPTTPPPDDPQGEAPKPKVTDDPPAKPPPSPNKFSPPSHPTGGWKPGDLLRTFLKPLTPAPNGSSTTPSQDPPASGQPSGSTGNDPAGPSAGSGGPSGSSGPAGSSGPSGS